MNLCPNCRVCYMQVRWLSLWCFEKYCPCRGYSERHIIDIKIVPPEEKVGEVICVY